MYVRNRAGPDARVSRARAGCPRLRVFNRYHSPRASYSFPASRMISVKIPALLGAALLASSTLTALPARADAQDAAKSPKPAHQHVLAAFSTRRLMILPTHYLRMGDSLNWADQISDQSAYLSGLDDEISFALSDRGVKKVWVFPAAIEAMAKRNEQYAPDPHGMAAQWLRFPGPKRLPEQVPDPIA